MRILALIIITVGFNTRSLHSQDLPDSLIKIIYESEIADTQLMRINEIMRGYSLKTKKDIDALYEIGMGLKANTDKRHIFRLKLYYVRHLGLIGEKEVSKSHLSTLLDEAIQANDSIFISAALQAQAHYLAEEGHPQMALDKLNLSIPYLINARSSEKASPYNLMGTILRDLGNYKQAQSSLDSVIYFAKNDSLSTNLASAYSSKGRIYRFQGKNDSALIMYKKAKKYVLINGNKLSLAVIYNNLGNLEHIGGDFNSALEFYIKSLEIKEELNDIRGTSIAYHNIGAILKDMKDWEKAKSYFNNSNKLSEEIDFKGLMVHNENKLGEIFLEESLIFEAIVHHEKALEISRSIKFKNGELTALLNLGNDYLKNNELDKANNLLLQGLKLSQDLKSKPQESAILVKLAESYIISEEENKAEKILESSQLTRKEIKDYLLRAKDLAYEMNNVENKLLALEGLDKYYINSKNYRDHVQTLKEYITLKDTVFQKDRIDAIADLETKYETAQKEKEIIQLENRNKIEKLKTQQIRNGLIGSTLLFLSFILFGYFYLKQRNRRRQTEQREKFRSKLSSDLHDDVGTILTGLAMQSELLGNFVSDDKKKIVNNLSSMSRDAMDKMRDTVWAIDSRKDKIDDLVHRMVDYAENILMTKDIQFIFNNNASELSLKINPEVRQNVYLIFKEAIANVIKHSNANKVEVEFYSNKNSVTLSIQDNGTVDADKVKKSGIGLTSINERVKKMNGSCNINYESGFHINVSMPLS